MNKDRELHKSLSRQAGLGRECHAGGGASGIFGAVSKAVSKATSKVPTSPKSVLNKLSKTMSGRDTKQTGGSPTLKDGRAIKMPRAAVAGDQLKGIKAARTGTMPVGMTKAAHFRKGEGVGCKSKKMMPERAEKSSGGLMDIIKDSFAKRAKHSKGAVTKVRKNEY